MKYDNKLLELYLDLTYFKNLILRMVANSLPKMKIG